MTQPPRRPSALLATASTMIADASASLVTPGSRFRHSFEVAVAAVLPDPQQPRKLFEAAEIAGLATTMREQGQLQPILLRRDPAQIQIGAGQGRGADRWIIVAGERRWRAAQHNGWATLLAMEAGADPEVATILENLQRVSLSPVEEARGLRRLLARKSWNQDRAAEMLGRSKGEISAALHILTLPESVLNAVLTSELVLSRNALVELSRLDEPARTALLAQARTEGLTVQAIRAARLSPPAPMPAPAPRAAAGAAGPSPRRLDPRRLDAASATIETAIRDGAVLDEVQRHALRRLRSSVETLLRGHDPAPPDAAHAPRRAARRRA